MPADRAPLDADLLRRRVVDAPGPWTGLVLLPETTSTNADAARLARDGAAAGTVVVAEHQTAGRGRLGRTFTTAPRTSVIVSVVLRPGPRVPVQAWTWLPLLSGLAVAATVRDAGLVPGVKWPNDVLVGDRKVCGILLERVETPDGPAAVVGIGVNVVQDADELPVPTATSFAVEGADVLDRGDVLVALLAHLGRLVDDWEAAAGDAAVGTPSLRERFRDACSTLGREVRVELPDGSVLVGTADDVDDQGRLVVDGRALSAGDVTHVRPVPA